MPSRNPKPTRSGPFASLLLGLGLCLLVFSACSSGTEGYVNTDVDFSYMERCAVLPFQNLSTDRYADERVQALFTLNLMRRGVLTVVEPGEVLQVMRRLDLQRGAEYSPEQYVELGEALGVQAIFYGAIDEYGIPKGSRDRNNRVTARFLMVETETGSVVWRSSVNQDGGSLWRGLAGTGTADLHDVSKAAVDAALDTLF